jgi:hypothetical protein
MVVQTSGRKIVFQGIERESAAGWTAGMNVWLGNADGVRTGREARPYRPAPCRSGPVFDIILKT